VVEERGGVVVGIMMGPIVTGSMEVFIFFYCD